MQTPNYKLAANIMIEGYLFVFGILSFILKVILLPGAGVGGTVGRVSTPSKNMRNY